MNETQTPNTMDLSNMTNEELCQLQDLSYEASKGRVEHGVYLVFKQLCFDAGRELMSRMK